MLSACGAGVQVVGATFGRDNVAAIAKFYNASVDTTDERWLASEMFTDSLYQCPGQNASGRVASVLTQPKSTVYVYRFNHAWSFGKVGWGTNLSVCVNEVRVPQRPLAAAIPTPRLGCEVAAHDSPCPAFPPPPPQTCAGSDVPFLFHSSLSALFTDAEQRLSQQMVLAWGSFASTGVPSATAGACA